MSYDGFYGELSTRGTVSELLNQANNIKSSIEASEAAVSADTSEVDWKHTEVTLKAAQVQTNTTLVETKAQEVTLKAAQVQTDANLVSTKAQEVTLKAAQVSTKAQEVTLKAAQVQTDANLVSTKAQEVTLNADQVQTDANLVSTKAQEVTLKAAQVQTNTTLVETKAQEVQDNSDYVAGIAAHYPPDVIGTADPRLTNAREWTATTITQAEAEAGTSTTRRAFTALSVRQAVVAWWNSITGVFGRDLVTSADSTTARSKLGLSDAATTTVAAIRAGNAGTADRTGALNWTHYGGGQGVGNGSHVIFDASNSKSPSGSAVNNTNPTVGWLYARPTLMGWDGTVTYGVRVDRARYAETLTSNITINGVEANVGSNITVADGTKLPLTGGALTGSLSVTGNITATGNVTAYSDIKLKKDIEVIPDALTKINTLHGYTYKRKDSGDTSRYTGVIAQEVQKVLPEAVMEDKDGTLSVAYGNMVGLLIEAIKELKAEVDELKGVK